MNLIECRNFIDCLQNLNTNSKKYIMKSGDRYEMINDKSKKNINSNEIRSIAERSLNFFKSSPIHSNDKKILFKQLGESLQIYSQRITKAPTCLVRLWNKIVALFFAIFCCKKPVTLSLSQLAEKALDFSKQISTEVTFETLKTAKAIAVTDIDQALKGLEHCPKQEKYRVMRTIRQQFLQFMKAIRSFGESQLQEKDPLARRRMLLEKSVVMDEVYGTYARLIHEVASKNTAWLADKIFVPSDPIPNEFYPTTVILPEGSQILVKYFQNNKKSPDVSICNSYQEYHQKLKDLASKQNGQFYYLVRCKDEEKVPDPSHLHQNAVFIEKMGDSLSVYIFDSNPAILDREILNFICEISKRTRQVFPEAHFYAPEKRRQFDLFNCNVFVLKDIKAIYKDEGKELKEKCQKHSFLPDPSICTKNVDGVRLTPTLPLSMMKTVQSTKMLQDAIKNGSDQKEVEKLRKLKEIYTFVDPRHDKEVYSYIKFFGLKYRLHIMENVFKD